MSVLSGLFYKIKFRARTLRNDLFVCKRDNITICGIHIYKKTVAVYTWATEIRYSILSNVLTLKQDSRGVQRLRFCGIVLYSKRNDGKYRTSRIFGIPFHKKDIRKGMLKGLMARISQKYDDIYISRHNIGETYVYLSHLRQWIKKNGSKKPVVIVWQHKDIDFYKMFVGKNIALQYVAIPQQDLHTIFTDEVMEYNGRKIFCPTPNILQNMLKTNSCRDFYRYICKDFDMVGKSDQIIPHIDPIVDSVIQNKIKKYFKKPFVVLIPDATSLHVLSSGFWEKIVKKLKNLGYDVFINSHSSTTSHVFTISDTSAISFDTTVGELYVLAKYSAGVISMASGIAVLLTNANIKMDLIYTDCALCNSVTIKEIYSVYHLPNIDKDKIKEYDANSYTEYDLANLILHRYKK